MAVDERATAASAETIELGRVDRDPGALVAIALILGGAIRANNRDDLGSPDSPAGGGSSVVVTYVVDGNSNQADITYQNANGDTSQIAEASLPWEEGFAVSSGAFVYVSAQRGEAPGHVTCPSRSTAW